ncbi:RNA-directed DNA polymerase, eukaryota, reverse transcriptase zinc-binding domain protein, partial [Tanacetum coccineum]
KGKGKHDGKAKQVAGIHLTKPKPKLVYREVQKTPTNNNDKATTSNTDSSIRKDNQPTIQPEDGINIVSLRNSFESLMEKDKDSLEDVLDDDDEEMFSLASWNIRGMNQTPKQKKVRQVIFDNNLCLCAILKSHVASSNLHRLCSKVFKQWQWTSNGLMCSKGDFNVLLSVDEKSTCPSYIDTGMRDFQDFVEAIKVSDVKSTGLQFTWNQKPKGKHGTLKMIDRIMANLDFYSSFVGSNAVLQPYRISDHSPAMLRIPMESTFNPRPFKFSKSQATRNCIDCVTTTNGVNVDGDQVPLAFIDHYSEFLGQQGVTSQLNFTDLFCNKLTSDVANYVVRDVSDQEIHEAMFVMGDNKAPGPDGYNVAFFKEAWEILATDVTKSIKEFFTNGVLLKELNHTILALIPKDHL